MAEDFENAGQRYLFLLRPIRDLSRNFETNIAKELDDYCSSLENIAANEEFEIDNSHRFNFAEAAMLVHGSAFVFGKKVDYVHSQAIHFFETLHPENNKGKTKRGAEEGDEGFVDGNESVIDPCDLIDYSAVKPCNVESLYEGLERTKYRGNPPKIKVMPMSLMPLADNEKSEGVIYSTGYRVEIVGKMDDFKMNSGFLNSRGVLLLHLANEKIVDDFASEAFVRLWNPHLFPPNETESQTLPGSGVKDYRHQATDFGRQSPTHGAAESSRGQVSSVVEMTRRVTANTFSGINSARPSTNLLEPVEVETGRLGFVAEGDFGSCDDDFCANGSLSLPIPPSDHNLRQQRPRAAPWDIAESENIESETENILLDPFEVAYWKVKPVETIKSFIRSTAVAAKIEKAENESATFQKRTMQTYDYIREHFYMRRKHKTTKSDDWQTDALYRFMVAVLKKKAEARRERAKTNVKPLSEVNYNSDHENDGNFECDDDDDDGFCDIDPGDIDDVPRKIGETATNEVENPVEFPKKNNIETLMFGDIDDDDLNNSINVESLYGGCLPSPESHPDGEKRKDAYTLLEILHQHMLKNSKRKSLWDISSVKEFIFWSTTEEITSELFVRVQEWENVMLPVLEEEEIRKDFDIHEYGDQLLEMFRIVGEVKTLNELLEGRKSYEVSRYFLACLMMANTCNVRVESDNQVDENGCRSSVMKVTLLKKERHHEVFDKAGAL